MHLWLTFLFATCSYSFNGLKDFLLLTHIHSYWVLCNNTYTQLAWAHIHSHTILHLLTCTCLSHRQRTANPSIHQRDTHTHIPTSEYLIANTCLHTRVFAHNFYSHTHTRYLSYDYFLFRIVYLLVFQTAAKHSGEERPLSSLLCLLFTHTSGV